METRTKFNVGDKVWIIQRNNYIYENCDICENTGAVKIKGKEFLCPECRGERKKIYKVNWDVTEEAREIKEIIIKKLENRPLKISYFCLDKSNHYIIEIHDEDCFATKEEAQKECDKRNGKI